MKLKSISTQAQEAIRIISAFDPNQADELLHGAISDVITSFSRELNLELKIEQKADKIWRSKRNELSLFYEITMLPSPNHFVTKIEYAKEILNSFKKLTSPDVLNDPVLLYPLIRNGLVFLTNEDVAILIKNNKELKNEQKEKISE